jgi:tetratricopeptide (TPR) repeat protein
MALPLTKWLNAEVPARELLSQAEAKIQAEQFAAAEAILSEAHKVHPSDIEILYRLGYARYRQRKLTAARTAFAEVVKTAPPAWYSRYFLGRISLLEAKPREAVTWLEPILASNESVFDTAAQIASAYAQAGLRDKAIAALHIAINTAPWDASLYYRLGRLYTESGNRQLAAEAFENSRRLRNATSEDVQALMRVSQTLTSGDPAQARNAAAPIVGRPDPDPNALVALGVIYGGANLAAEALEAFERAAARDPAFFQAQYNRGLALLKMNRSAEALAPLARAVDLLPESVEANRTYGLAAVMNQRYVEAVPPLERAWAADPGNLRAGALLATAYLRTGSAKKAAALLKEQKFVNADDPATLLLRVEALNAADDGSEALDAALQAQKKFPRLPQTHMAVAGQLTRLGRYNEAKPAFAETLKLAPGYPEAELGFADTLSRSGDHAAAIEHYRVAIHAATTAIAARAGLARSLTALRRFEEAQTILEESVAAYPAEPALRVELSRVYARLGKPDLAAEQTRIIEKLRGEGSRR